MEEKELEPTTDREGTENEEPSAGEEVFSQSETPLPEEETDTCDYAKLAEEDMAALREEFPELSGKRSVTELDAPLRYAELRDLGLSPREAYLAVGGGRNLPTDRPSAHYDNRAHLRTSVPRSASPAEESLTAAEMASARDLFSDLGDAEIRRLYRRVTVGK